ncbi:MAG: hypothetical protein JWQ30_312 [Sediminibacterium sp.]|nr:hypothetical protein [Sediminibacterium sp.]
MDQHLYKYLVLYKHLCIPQLGSFVIQPQNSRYDESTGLLHGPSSAMVFTDAQVVVSEKIFFDFLANEMGVDDLTAIKLFHDFSYQFRNDLQEKGSVELTEVGRLTKEEDTIVFHPSHSVSELIPGVRLEKGMTLTEEIGSIEEIDTEENKDPWWMYAIVLVMLGIGALIFYYS